MVEKIFFQSSLPRSGSTLLQNILAQNPDIYSTPTSGMCELLAQSKNTFSSSTEFLAQNQDVMTSGFKGFCKSGLYGFYNNITDRKYVFEKCRAWSVMYDFVNWFDPDPKMVIMIRDLRSIVCSLEKKFRKNPHLQTNIQNWNILTGTTVDKRVELFLTGVPPLSGPLDIIYDIILRRIAKKCLFIKYEDLCKNPEAEIKKIYSYIGVPYYSHDFNNIKQFTKENDVLYQPFGDHDIRNILKPLPDDYIDVLGKHNCDYIKEKYNWFYKAFSY